MLPGDLEAQLMPGSLSHAVKHIGDALDLLPFDAHYRNDDVGASAHAPSMLLKAALLAYSARACQFARVKADFSTPC